MSSLFGSGGAALGGAAPPPSAQGFLAASSGGGSLFASSNVGDSGLASSTRAAPSAAGGGLLFSSSSGNKASGAGLSCTNSTDGKVSLFGGDGSNAPLSSGLKTSNLLQGMSKGDSRPAGAGFAGGSLFGNTSGSAAAAGPPLTGQGAVTPNPASGGGSLFGSAGAKPFSLLNTGSSVPSATTAGAAASASSSHSSVPGSDPSSNTSSSSTSASSGVSSSLFGTAAGQTASSARLFGSDPGKQAAASSSDSPQPGENPGQSSASLSTTFNTATESKTGAVSPAPGGLFGSSSAQIPPVSTTSGLHDTKAQDGVAQSGTSTSVGGGAASGEPTAGGKKVDGASLSLSAASGGAGTSDGGLFGKPNLSSTSSSSTTVDTSSKAGQKSVSPPASAAAPAAQSSSKDSTTVVPRAAAGGLPPPQEVALETLQHELLEEVLAKWERRLERRVGQFIAVAEEVESVEKAMIEESRKIQQVMHEQGKLERKQVYTARVIDSLEHQQRDLMTLLRSIEGAVLELRGGGPRNILSSSGKHTGVLGNYTAAAAAARTRDPGMWFRLLKTGGGEEAGPGAISGEPDGRTALPGKSFIDQSAGVASMPLLSSAEQLALERLRSFDQQLAEVSQSLSYTAETFQAGSLGAVAQVLAVHQAALRAAASQAAQIGERVRQLQDVWEVSKGGRAGGRGGFLKPSG